MTLENGRRRCCTFLVVLRNDAIWILVSRESDYLAISTRSSVSPKYGRENCRQARVLVLRTRRPLSRGSNLWLNEAAGYEWGAPIWRVVFMLVHPSSYTREVEYSFLSSSLLKLTLKVWVFMIMLKETDFSFDFFSNTALRFMLIYSALIFTYEFSCFSLYACSNLFNFLLVYNFKSGCRINTWLRENKFFVLSNFVLSLGDLKAIEWPTPTLLVISHCFERSYVRGMEIFSWSIERVWRLSYCSQKLCLIVLSMVWIVNVMCCSN